MNSDTREVLERSFSEPSTIGHPWYSYRLSWGSIIAGTFIAMAIQILLMMMEAGFGLTFPTPLNLEHEQGISFVAGIAGVLNYFVSLWVGGWIAGRTAGDGHGNVGGLHGVTVWAVATTAGFLLLPRFGSVWLPDLGESQVGPLRATGASWSFLATAVGAFAGGWGGRHGALRGFTFRRNQPSGG